MGWNLMNLKFSSNSPINSVIHPVLGMVKQAQNCEWVIGHRIRVSLTAKCTIFLTIISMKVTVI